MSFPVHVGNAKKHYRAEIDGLRALAVLGVVLYHAGVPGWSGGFGGVDVFFAISGYVVVGSLLREQRLRGAVDWFQFLVRRTRRLLPMLLVTVSASLALGWWLLQPFGDLQRLCESAIAALGLSANLFFWKYGGFYFDAGIEQMPLLHLWSLSVEEQFYLMLPLLFLLSRLLGQRHFTGMVCALTAASFALALWATASYPSAGFYLPVTRAWEFGVGALAALLPARPQSAARVGNACLVLVVLSLLLLDPDSKLQPLAAGLPALFTALLLHALAGPSGRSTALLVLRHPGAVWVGQRAYAWYLLHWPAIVFYRRYWLEDVSVGSLLAISLLTLLLAAAAHRWVENPLRYGSSRWLTTRFRLMSLALLSVATVMTAALALGNSASQLQVEPRWRVLSNLPEWAYGAGHCVHDGKWVDQQPKSCASGRLTGGREALFLWGDSHAGHLWPALSQLARNEGDLLTTWSMGGCPPLIHWTSDRDFAGFNLQACQYVAAQASRQILESAAAGPTIVVLAARWEPYLGEMPVSVADIKSQKKLMRNLDLPRERAHFTRSLLDTVTTLTRAGVQVVLVAPVPEQRVVVPHCLLQFPQDQCETMRGDVAQYRQSSVELLKTAVASSPSVQLIDPMDVLCNGTHCQIGNRDLPWYIDDDHLTAAGADRLTPLFKAAIDTARDRLASKPAHHAPPRN